MRISPLYFLVFFLTIVLAVRFFLFYHNIPPLEDGTRLVFVIRLDTEPKVFGNREVFTAKIASGHSIIVSGAGSWQLRYGDVVRISGTVKKRVIGNKKVVMVMNFPKIVRMDNQGDLGMALIISLRQKLISLFSGALPEPFSSLLLGIVFGIKEQMPKDFSNSLRISGVMHVIAASGMNITMVAGFFSGFFSLFLKRQSAILITIFLIFFYSVLAGFEASIVRAMIMGILMLSAQLIGRQSLSAYSLGIAGFFMLFFSPPLLLDIGFQLSFCATLGLLYFSPLLFSGEHGQRFLKKTLIGQDLVTTISAQVSTLPILLANFGTYSLFSILVNTLVLWTIPLLMIGGGAGAVVGLIIPFLGRLILLCCIPLLWYFGTVVTLAGSLPFFQISGLSPFIIIGYYLILAGFIFPWKNNHVAAGQLGSIVCV